AAATPPVLYLLSLVRPLKGAVAAPGRARPHHEEAEHIRAEAAAYFDLARSNASGLPAPLLALVMRLPASGKTTLAQALVGRLGLVHISSDVVRKELAHLAPGEPAARPFAKAFYAPTMPRRTYA